VVPESLRNAISKPFLKRLSVNNGPDILPTCAKFILPTQYLLDYLSKLCRTVIGLSKSGADVNDR